MFFCLPVLFLVIACGNNTESTNTEPMHNNANVENVNGGLPDTSNSIKLNKNLEVDSSKVKDSLKH